MSYPQQPGNWSDPSWPPSQPQPYGDPSQPSGVPASPAGYPTSPTSGYPGYPPQAYPAQAYPAQAYPAQAYQNQAAYPNYGYNAPVTGSPKVNGLAIASLICSIAGIVTCGVTSIVGAILGHVARGQIAQRQESGSGMALGGIITGWIVTAIWAVVWALVIAGIAASDGGTTTSDFDDFLRAFSLRAA